MALQVAESIKSRFPKSRKIAFTYRFTEPNGNLKYFAELYNGSEIFHSASFYREVIVDSVGSGDSFMAGLIYGMLENMPDQDLINFAAASAVSKLNIKGDANTTPVEEIKKLIG
jgi:2-dehydro-3-deoxygluconokinase